MRIDRTVADRAVFRWHQNRWVTGQLVEVGNDAGQHPEHAGAVERHGFRLGIGLGPQIHHDPLPAVQASQPRAAPAGSSQLAREASLKVRRKRGASRLRTGMVGQALPPPLAEPRGDRASLLRAEELVDPTRAETRDYREARAARRPAF
jgi:hypothetical protein